MARNSKPKMAKILSYQDPSEITVRGQGGVLSRLFQTILIDLRITNAKWESLLKEYMNDPRNKMPKDRNTQTSRQGNLVKELSDFKMTWKVFCKAMNLLQFVRIEFSVRAYHRHGGRISQHSVGVDFVNPQDEERLAEATITSEFKEPTQEAVTSKPLKGLDQ